MLRLRLLRLLFGPVEHALRAGRLKVQPAQGAGRAGDEIVSGRRGTVAGSRRRCWRSRRRLPHENRHPVLLARAADRVDAAGRGPAAADLETKRGPISRYYYYLLLLVASNIIFCF